MAIFSVPFFSIHLVAHAAGGAIVHYAGGYVANTYLSSSVMTALSGASSTLTAMAGSAATVLTSPAVVGVALALAVSGGYCYFFGIPAPVQAALIKAGVATPAKGGLAVPIVKLTTTLILIGLAGLLTINVFKRISQARRSAKKPLSIDDAQSISSAVFGKPAWADYGHAVWLGATDTTDQVLRWATNAASGARAAGESAAIYATSKGDSAIRSVWGLGSGFKVRFADISARLFR